MTGDPPDTPIDRVRAFWRRTLRGPGVGARIETYEELAPTVGAGIGIREAVHFAADRHGGAKRRMLDLLADGLERDVPLSATMLRNPDVFSAVEAALVATGERTGRLDAAFRAAAAQLEKTRATRNRIIQATAYPFFVLHIFVLTLSIVRASGGHSFLATALMLLAVIWGTLLGVVSVHAAIADSPSYARFLGHLPVIGTALTSAALTRFSRAFAALHGAGMTYDESLRIAAEASGSPLLRAEAAVANDAMARGAPFPVAIAQMPSIPPEARGLLSAGEQSGELESAAQRVAALQEERGDVVTKRAISLLPGCLIALVGIAVGALYLSVMGNYLKQLDDVMK